MNASDDFRRSAAIIGAGTMGLGVAQCFALAGLDVTFSWTRRRHASQASAGSPRRSASAHSCRCRAVAAKGCRLNRRGSVGAASEI